MVSPTIASATAGAVRCEDGVLRCSWAVADPLLRAYHDTEWGRSVHGEQALLERICLEGFQAGLSWLTVLRKRPAFRAAFADFDPDTVAALTDDEIEALAQLPAIIRNRAKINAARGNARAVLGLRPHGGLDALLWSYADPGAFHPRTALDVPAQTPSSVRMAQELKALGFRFVGPTTCFALMEATGMVNTHLMGCHRRG
ncbi:DNA-3-methyladenine glycosylase I [Tomitella biformata]|uniref:DNA-3-methyladenine glycosylase I n=1 Tax=Tomitella biformata TaxID=630403 RepID=UPI00056EAB51|nr:DNA-3-methyladenine glycosylase I [Tomitella biformata]